MLKRYLYTTTTATTTLTYYATGVAAAAAAIYKSFWSSKKATASILLFFPPLYMTLLKADTFRTHRSLFSQFNLRTLPIILCGVIKV